VNDIEASARRGLSLFRFQVLYSKVRHGAALAPPILL
jgi:hypothetical protein